MKESFRSITKVTLAFVLIFILSGCDSSASTIDPEATLPEIGPGEITYLPQVGPGFIDVETTEASSSEEEETIIEITTTEIESTEQVTTEDESTKETSEPEESSSEVPITVEETSSEAETSASTEEPSTESETEKSRFTFSEMGAHMYVQASVNNRTLPCTEGSIAFVLDTNEIVYVTGKCNETGWYRIDVEGQTFYVSNKYVGPDKVVYRSTNSAPATTNASGFVYYSVAGQYPNKDYEQYLYNQLSSLGIGWWYPYAVAQIFQESRWNPNSTNGRDHGICQFKGIYFQGRAEHFAGMKNADIWNPYDSLKVYAYYIKAILQSHGNNVNSTLSFYICGDDAHWDQTYIDHVMSWYKQLQRG